MKTPVLTTERLLLRPLYVSDAEVFYNNIGTDPEVARFMLWNMHESIEDTIEWLEFEESVHDNEEYYTWAIVIKENEKIIGSGGFKYSETEDLYEIGYDIMKEEWNKGYVTEFATAILDFATDELGEEQVLGKHAIDNPASGKVLKKAGFVYMGEGECYSFDGSRSFHCLQYIYEKLK